MATENKRLQELGGSDFEIVDGQPDIRGWDVRNSEGKRIGEVDELIFDAQSRKVRYIVLDMDDNELDLDDREVLIPIGMAQLHKEDDDVILQNITTEQLRSLPVYDHDNLDEISERRICEAFGRDTTGFAAGSSLHDSDFYRHEHFNDQNLYSNRRLLPDSTTETHKEDEEGYRLRNKAGFSGSEVMGYTGSGDSTGLQGDRSIDSTVPRSERIEDNAAVPVNWSEKDQEQRRHNQDLMNNDLLTGDNVRPRTDEDDDSVRR